MNKDLEAKDVQNRQRTASTGATALNERSAVTAERLVHSPDQPVEELLVECLGKRISRGSRLVGRERNVVNRLRLVASYHHLPCDDHAVECVAFDVQQLRRDVQWVPVENGAPAFEAVMIAVSCCKCGAED